MVAHQSIIFRRSFQLSCLVNASNFCDHDPVQDLFVRSDSDLMSSPLFSKLLHVLSLGRRGRPRNSSALPLLDENNLPGAEDWMLTRPAFGREIEGYASVCSATNGKRLTFT
jgi:hypothetical protein